MNLGERVESPLQGGGRWFDSSIAHLENSCKLRYFAKIRREPDHPQLIADCSSCQALLEERAQLPLSGVFRDRLLHLQGGLPAVELEGGEVVIEPRLFVHQASAEWRFFNPGEAGEADVRVRRRE